MSGRSYADLVHPLPRPTPSQVDSFVTHVAEAENWLKPATGEGSAAITIFLDPNAGARLNQERVSRRYVVEPLEDGMELLHGSEKPTQAYRASHGYLNYHAELGAGTAEVEGELLRRARLPGPGVVFGGEFVPLPEALRSGVCRPGPFLHGTFRAPHDEGSLRRFRYAVERLPKLGAPRDPELLARIEAWREVCRAQDEAAFDTWLDSVHGENRSTLDEASRWRRYIVWRDEDACTAMHRAQDGDFRRSGIPDEVTRLHAAALQQVRDCTIAALRQLDALLAS